MTNVPIAAMTWLMVRPWKKHTDGDHSRAVQQRADVVAKENAPRERGGEKAHRDGRQQCQGVRNEIHAERREELAHNDARHADRRRDERLVGLILAVSLCCAP